MYYKNYYCDSLASFIYEVYPRIDLEDFEISKQDDALLCDYAVLKNKLAGVAELNIGCKFSENGLSALKKYGLKGNAVVSAKDYEFKENVIPHIKSLLDYSESQLQELSTLALKKPVMITFGRSLDEMGMIDKTYNLSPAHFIEDLGFLDRECYILGGNYLDKDELNVLGGYDTRIILSPCADMLLGRGFVNLSPLRSQNISIGFASDVYPKVDMMQEIWLSAGQTANLMHNPNLVTEEILQKIITVEGSPPIQKEEESELKKLRSKLDNLIKKL